MAFAPALLDAVVTGQVDDESWRRSVVAALADRYGRHRAEAAVEAWSAPVGKVDRDTLTVLDGVAPHVHVVLATNATSRLDDDLRRLDLARRFDAVVNSSAIGWAKPSARFFEQALAVAGIAAAQALFVDDSAENVRAAIDLGIASHRFETAELLRQFLQRHGVWREPGAERRGR